MRLRKEKDTETIPTPKEIISKIKQPKKSALHKQITAIIAKNDLNLIDRERMGDIRTISTEALTKDLVTFVKGIKNEL